MTKIDQIFISYKSEYRHHAEKVRDHLMAWGYQVWLDVERIKPGEYFRYRIDEGLKASQAVIGIATPEAILSREVMWEWDYGLYHSRLIPLLYADFELPYHLKGTQYIKCIPDERIALEQLRQAIDSPAPVVSTPTRINPILPTVNNERQTMLGLVQSMWVEGILHQTLHENQALEIPRSLAPDRVLHHVNFGDYPLPDESDILQLFSDMQRELLILGDPGAGKTILMLQLAEKLIVQAQIDPKQPIPVVLNLSSWAANPQQNLQTWLIHSLHTVYPMSKKLAEEWVEGEKLLLLLDGLDEMAVQHRNACVEAINAFRRRYQLVDMVVCSRIKDYDVLTSRLDLRGGLLLEVLSTAQIGAYLSDEAYLGLREAMQADATLQDFAQTPFLLNILGVVYRNLSALALRLPQTADPISARRDDLMGRFVNLRLTEATQQGYTPAQVRHYLTWLAKNMVERDQIIFQVESLQPDWLPHRQKWLYQILIGICLGGFLGLVFGIFFGVVLGGFWGVTGGVILGLVLGVFFSMAVLDSVIKPKEQLQLDLSPSRLWIAFKNSVFLGMFWGVVGGLFWGAAGDAFLGRFWGMVGGAIVGMVWGMVVNVVREATLKNKTSINQGIKASFKNSVGIVGGAFLVCGVIGGMFWGVVWGVFLGMFSGVVLGVTLGGGLAVIQHITLRWILGHYSYAPTNYAKFLIYCTDDLQLLRQVGGSFIFHHRTLLEYFAAQYWAEDYR